MARNFSKLIFSLLLLSFIGVFAAHAADKEEVKKLEAENRAKVEAEIKKDTPISEWISSENALLKRLAKPSQESFFIFRNKHSIIRAVESVQRDVGNAVKACSKNNKDMSKEMNARFNQWSDSITPILKEAKKFQAKELDEQKAFHVSDYNHVMGLNDKAYTYSEKQVKKTPVTSKESCQGLLASMDRTEDNLIDILQDALLPEDVVRERVEQANKAKAAAKEKSKSKSKEK